MAIYCQEHNKSTAHAINHERGNEPVLLQQMNGRTEGGEKKRKLQQNSHKHHKSCIYFSASSMKNKLQICDLGKVQMQ